MKPHPRSLVTRTRLQVSRVEYGFPRLLGIVDRYSRSCTFRPLRLKDPIFIKLKTELVAKNLSSLAVLIYYSQILLVPLDENLS